MAARRHTYFLCDSGTAAINFGRISAGRFLKISLSISLGGRVSPSISLGGRVSLSISLGGRVSPSISLRDVSL